MPVTCLLRNLRLAVTLASGVCLMQTAHADTSQEAEAQPREWQRIAQQMQNNRTVTAEDYRQLERAYHSNPGNSKLNALYFSALLIREDWPAIIDYLEAIPQNNRSQRQTLNLAAAYLKNGDFALAQRTASDLVNVSSLARSICAQSALSLGNRAEAIQLLKPDLDNLIAQGKVSDLIVLATAYFESDKLTEALATIEQVKRLDQNNVVAAQLAGRLYAAQGDATRADEQFALVEREYAALTARETEGIRLRFYSEALQEALDAQQYQRVLSLVEQARGQLDSRHDAILRQFEDLAVRGLNQSKSSSSQP